ncbi:hypothetical protein [Filimonas effusa]|uniref:Uncharacterized protein n=1 Tax=Filimonas effusa TaxID=2508721 RepID=A0A4Q1D8N8_9BACT|nr:hypothetical protein [Filimonas effusa]RXK85714.1 hypothetical protein ESB13_02545 [Filimonas effusa]
MHKLIFAGSLLLLSFLQCQMTEPAMHVAAAGKTYNTVHFNLIFSSDLSNRVNPTLYKRPLNDGDILSIVTQNLYPSILRCKRSENQKDKLLVDFINKGLITQYAVNTDKLFIDFGRFKNQNERIAYIAERNGVKETLRKDIGDMRAEFQKMNGLAAKENFGADIWSYFNQGIDNKRVLAPEAAVRYESNVFINTYRNVLILATDGYIEAGIFGQGVDLSKNTIDRFRKAYLSSGVTNMRDFLRKSKKFQIKPVANENLKNLEVLVMELYDRSLSKGGTATVLPTDMEIIQLFWTEWLEASKVKRFELHPYASSKDEAEKIILNFLGVEKL